MHQQNTGEQINCPHCGRSLLISNSSSRLNVVCPECKSDFSVRPDPEPSIVRLRKSLLVGAYVLVWISTIGLSYLTYAESAARPPERFNYMFATVDLVLGRTHFEQRNREGRVVATLDAGPATRGRIGIARSFFVIFLLGAGILIVRSIARRKTRTVSTTSQMSNVAGNQNEIRTTPPLQI